MNWYLTKLVYRIICGQGRHMPQFDEQLRLIEATDEAEAYMKAHTIGEREQDQFYNESEKLVQWKFINITELHKLGSFLDGAELYSRIHETDNAEGYIEMTNKKAAYIRMNTTYSALEN